ncbi:MAG: cobalamin-dependent protein [Candidatus Omnitrophica bacterium]|nr:cobalamin-dependent protein [Candidatus Omnitrophota bacterium]
MRILLLTAPLPVQNASFPIGLSYIGTVLKQKGYEVKIVDSIAPFKKYSKNDIKELIKIYKPDIVGFSLFINFITEVYDFVMELKGTFNNIIFIAGGPHASALPEEVIQHGFDFVVIGEGEEIVVELANSIEKQNRPYEKIKGLAFKNRKDNKIIITEPNPYIKDLDCLPFPERESFPIENYTGSLDSDSDPYFWILSSSRGCPFNCSYCMNADVFGRNYRFRSAENIFQEIQYLYTSFNVRYIYFIDDEFMINKERIYRMIDLLAENKLNIGWTALARITNINTEFINRMFKAGLKEIVYGVESGDPTTLKKINKGMSLEQIRNGIEDTLKSQIPTFGINNMIGFPWEKRENIINTYRLNKSIGNSVQVSHSFWVPIPYPRTALYNAYHKQYGFTNWWLNINNFSPEYDSNNYSPFFKKHMFFLDHPQLRINLYRYKLFHRLFIKSIFIKVWFLQAERRFGTKKKNLIFIFSLFSYFLFFISPELEKFVFKLLLNSFIYQCFKNFFHIKKQVSIADCAGRNKQ